MIVQPYRNVSYSIGNTNPGMPGMGNVGPGMHGGMGNGTSVMPAGMGSVPPQVSSGSPMTPTGAVMSTTPPVFEQSYIENILRLNLGKTGTFYMTYENNQNWNAKIFKGILEAAGRDHIILSDRATGQRVILLMVNFDYATFDEPLTYQYPGVIGSPGVTR